MRKALLLIGKCLLCFGFLWPVPFGFIIYPFIEGRYDIPMWGVKHGYWWMLLGFIVVGFIITAITPYTPKENMQQSQISVKQSPFWVMAKTIMWCFVGVVAWFLLVILFCGIIYAIKNINIVAPIIGCIVIVVYALYIGVRFFTNKDNT